MMRPCLIAAALVLFCCSTWAEQTNSEPTNSSQITPIQAVVFECVPPGSSPRYSLTVDSTGHSKYVVQDSEKDSDEGPYSLEFRVSEGTRGRIFELAKKANYFDGDFEYKKSQVANLGAKTLTYVDPATGNSGAPGETGQHNRATYNWSENPTIQQLTEVFQRLSTTLDFGRRLAFKRRFDKLGLDAELKQMEEAQQQGRLVEVQAIAPVLKGIVSDTSIMHVARQRAENLLTNSASEQSSQ
jgi:hypothetical protein